jgi:hypothetical protein
VSARESAQIFELGTSQFIPGGLAPVHITKKIWINSSFSGMDPRLLQGSETGFFLGCRALKFKMHTKGLKKVIDTTHL